MRKLFYISALTLFISCQIEDDNAPKPEEGFIKYLGQLANQEAKDIEPVYADDGTTLEGFVVFGTQQLEDSTTDYYVIRTDVNGTLINEVSFGFKNSLERDFDQDGEDDILEGEESAGQIHSLAGGGFVTVGTTTISNNILGITDYKIVTIGFLDNDLNIQVGPMGQEVFVFDASPDNFTDDLIGNDIIQLSDGTLLLVGSRETSSNFDLYYTRFSLDSVYYEKTIDLGSGDAFVRAFDNPNDQTINLFGYTNDPGVDGARGVNVTYVEVNYNGNILKSNSNGIPEPTPVINYDDVLTDVVEVPGGYAAVGTSTINEDTYGFFMSLDNEGVATFSDTLSSEFSLDGTFSTQLQTQAFGVTRTINNDYVVVGQYPSFRVGTQNRGGEAMFFRVDQIGNKINGYESNFGLGDGNDAAADAITLPDGKIIVASTTDFGGGVKLISLIKLNDTGELDR